MNIEEVIKIVDIEFEHFRLILFLAEKNIATESELLKIFPKSSQTLNRHLKDLILRGLVSKRRDVLKEKRYAHNIYSSTTKLYDLIEYLSESISKITPQNSTVSPDIQDFGKISEA